MTIDLTVYPDECDAFGHLNQASFLSLFERARWEMLARGPGMDVFTRAGAWPAVRKTVVDYHAAAFPGDVLRFEQTLTHRGRTSFTMRQTARRTRDDTLIATAEFVFVCVDHDGRPIPVPTDFGSFMEVRRADAGDVQRVMVNGVNLAVEIRGEAREPAILFIHGYPLDHTIWADQLEGLGGYRRIAPDLRGMGRSDAPDLGYGIGIYAADLAALLDALGVDDVILCGFSLGGYVAFEFLRRWRSRVRALVLVSTRAEADTADGRRARDAAAALARENGSGAIADGMIGKMLTAETLAGSPEFAQQVRMLMASAPVPGIVGALAAMRDRPDSMGLLPMLEGIPALVVVGADDQLTPPDRAKAMADAIPGARLDIIPGAAHLTVMEKPREVTAAIRRFVEELKASL